MYIYILYCKYLPNVYIHIYIHIFIYLFLIDIEKTEDMCTVHDYMFVNTFYHICHLLGTSDWVSEWDCQLRNAQVYCTFLDHVFVQCITYAYIVWFIYMCIFIYIHTLWHTYMSYVCFASHLEMSAPRLMSWNVSSTGSFIHFWSALWLGCPF